ncbi:MAG: type II toxin-antitoxin system VapC family toxin [Chloroflexi bacterium]|nr:type II toxin-antitoxin system VapC family toxin [Chloroflexota bacterium]
MRAVVIDASVVLRWLLLDELDRAPALAIRDRIQAGLLDPSQPPYFPMEVASALVAAARAGRLVPSAVGPLMRSLEAFRLDLMSPSDFASAAVETALELGLRVPDAGYIVCARRTGGTLITADRRLFEAALRAGAAVAHLDELAA